MSMNEKDWLIVVLTIVVLGIIIIALVHVDNQYNTITLGKDFFNDIVKYFNN